MSFAQHLRKILRFKIHAFEIQFKIQDLSLYYLTANLLNALVYVDIEQGKKWSYLKWKIKQIIFGFCFILFMAKFEVFHGVFSSSIILLFLKSDVLFFLKNNISLNSNPQFDNSKCHKLLLNVYKFLWEVANLKTLIAFVTQLMLYAIYFFEVTSSMYMFMYS